MQQDTKNKFAEILAAAQKKANSQMQPQATNKATINEMVHKSNVDNVIPSKMSLFTIIWQEGSGKYDGKTFNTWKAAHEAMKEIYYEHSGLGYLKVKINVSWENGREITDRVDCSDNGGDFSANRETIGEYLKRHNSVMYASNLQKGDRQTLLSFEDDIITSYIEQVKSEAPNVEVLTEYENKTIQELSSITVDDLLNDKPIYCAQVKFELKSNSIPKAAVKIVDYSDKAFAVIGETKPIKDTLKTLGGKFNMWLNCGAGWIFPKTKLELVKIKLAL